MKKLLFISNLFPDASEPYRGLDNATVLHALRAHYEIRVLSVRPTLPLLGKTEQLKCRAGDEVLAPIFVRAPYVPKVGGLANHHLMAKAMRQPLAALRREFAWDGVMTSWLFPDSWAVWRALGGGHGPLVCIAQGSDVHRYLRSASRKRAILEVLSHADGCITRSASLSTMLAEAGADARRLHPITNGIDTGVFHLMQRVEGGERVLLFVGNLLPVKDPLFMLRCFTELKRRRPAEILRLVMIGKGPMEAELRDEARKLGVADSVTLTGPLQAPEVADWMRRAEMLCMTSRNEGLPNVVLEAQGCGLPVVATDVGGIRECVNEDWLGRLTPLDDAPQWVSAVESLLDSPVDRTRIAGLGAERNWPETALRYREVIEAAITASR